MIIDVETSTYRQAIMILVLLVTANKREPTPERIAPSRRVPIRPRTDVMGDADSAPVIDPSVKIAAIRPNLDDCSVSSTVKVEACFVEVIRTVMSIHPSRSPIPR